MYRGAIDGNPANSISFKAVFGSSEPTIAKFEPSTAQCGWSVLSTRRGPISGRRRGASEFRLLVQDGIGGGNSIYNYGVPDGGDVCAVAA